jgi:hypothetical protein
MAEPVPVTFVVRPEIYCVVALDATGQKTKIGADIRNLSVTFETASQKISAGDIALLRE